MSKRIPVKINRLTSRHDTAVNFSAGGLGGLISFEHNADAGTVDIELSRLDSCVRVTVPPANVRNEVQRFYAMKIEANNDANGNPRRGWLVYDANGIFQGFADEGYRGSGALINAAAILAGHDVETHQQGGNTNAAYDGRDGSTADGPKGTVRLSVMGVVATTPAEYRHALAHGTKKDPMYPDTIYRQF